MKRLMPGCAVAALTAALLPVAGKAAENGNTQYSPGSSGFYSGAIPPVQGLYALSQTSYYSADRLTDDNGDRLPVSFGADVKVETLRLLGVTGWEAAGGKVWWQLVMPVILDMDISAGSHGGSTSGLSDVLVAGGLAWHSGAHTYVFGIDVALPTGDYDPGRLANAGLNHWSIQPTFGYHYLDVTDPAWEVAIGVRYLKNFENSDTDYTSGDELVIDYAAGYNFGSFRAAVSGYLLEQLTDDEGPNVASDGNRGKGVAIGPSLNYTFANHALLGISWQKEIETESRPQGDTWQISFATRF
ncbi:SphA family protein [Falsirhodobacter sp. 1013]|uniref:SphA family protein n=1 Tax=Falsirhodobacter sp. 1013 TaxID=3417566 RepID=UPI003EC00865